MAYTLGGVALPYSLFWVNEQEWTPYRQSQDYSITGALLLQASVKLAGRPITLSGTTDSAWITHATLTALRELLTVDPLPLILPDGRTFSVTWDHAGPPIAATPVISRWTGDDRKYSAVTLKLIER